GGALIQPLGGGAIALVAVAVESILVAYRRLMSRTEYLVLSTRYLGLRPDWPLLRRVFNLLIPGLAALAILASLTIPGTSSWSVFWAWVVLLAAELGQWLLYDRASLTNGRWW